EPAEPVGDRLTDARVGRPQADVPIEQTIDPFLAPSPFDRRLVVGGRRPERQSRGGDGGGRGFGHRGLPRLGPSMVRRDILARPVPPLSTRCHFVRLVVRVRARLRLRLRPRAVTGGSGSTTRTAPW